jgi:hypothetical protein
MTMVTRRARAWTINVGKAGLADGVEFSKGTVNPIQRPIVTTPITSASWQTHVKKKAC